MTARLGVLVLAAAAAACAGEETGVRFSAARPAPWPVQGTALAVVAPQPGDVVANPVRVELFVQNLDARDGRHLHVVVDDEPYMDVAQVDQPVELPELAPGPHTVRIFPAHASHEAVKVTGAFEAVGFYVGEQDGDLALTPGAPLLTWNLPAGAYEGDAADSVPVDFFIRNAQLGPNGHRVRVTVDGTARELIQAWVPYTISGLTPGDHVIRMELLDPANRAVAGAFNAVERTITIQP